MISIDILRRVTVVYTHAHCADGLASAMILRDAFRMLGTSPRIEFLAHGTPEHQRAGLTQLSEDEQNVYLFCDIAPHGSVAATQRRKTIVLDHHKGVEELVRSFGALGVFADEKLDPGVSGAVLAFREVWKPINKARGVHPEIELAERNWTREFAEAIGARDTWQTKHAAFQRGQWISKLLMSKPSSYWLERQATGRGHSSGVHIGESELGAGRALFEAHEEAVRQAVDQCVRMTIGDSSEASTSPRTILFVFQEQASGFRLCSDVAESLRSEWRTPAVVAGFSYVVDKPGAAPRLLYSLRGLNGFDVAAFAKANGGGGHTAAAGFSVNIRKNDIGPAIVMTDPYEEIRRKLEQLLICGAGSSS